MTRSKLLTALQVITAAASMIIFCISIVHVWRSAIIGDSAIFLAIGRGILNGVAPYSGLFETKPLGIFILGAIAQLADAILLAKIFVVVAYLLVFACPFLLEWRRGFLVGIFIALLISGDAIFRPELFGTVALCYYAVVMQKRTPWKLGLCSILLYLALLFKEPLVVSALAVSLLLPTVEEWIRYYVIALLFAGLLLVGTLLFFGVLEPYLTMYLPFMVSVRVGEAPFRWMELAQRMLFTSPLFLPLLAYSLPKMKLWKLSLFVICVCAAMYFGNLSHGPVIAIAPVSMLLFMKTDRKWIVELIVIAILLIPLTTDVLAIGAKDSLESERSVALKLDTIMDRCSIQKYYYLGNGNSFYAFTRHSPIGPLLFLEMYMLRNDYLVRETMANIQKADIILFEKKTRALAIEKQFYDLTQDYVVHNFQQIPWNCAGETINTEKFILLFRRGAKGDSAMGSQE